MIELTIVKCEDGTIKLKFPNSEQKLADHDYWQSVNYGFVEIKVNNYYAHGRIWISHKEIEHFYNQLSIAHHKCFGQAKLSNDEYNFETILEYKKRGLVEIKGFYKERPDKDNELKFHIETDQSYINQLVEKFKEIFVG